MATHGQYLEPPIEIPKRHTPWFVWMMGGFALMVVAALVYSFAKIAWLPMPTLEVPAQESPSRPAIPESPAPRPAAPEAK